MNPPKKPRLQMLAAIGTHRGDRQYQQDRVEIFAHQRAGGVLLAVVADGMGGRSGGRMAADQVVLTARQLFDRFVPGTDDPRDFMQTLLRESHTMIRLNAISAEQEPHSTMACVLVLPPGECHWAHVGDTRIQLFRDGRLQRRSRDHSYVQDLVDAGSLSEAAARNHPMSNVLTASLGTAEDPPFAYASLTIEAGDTVLVCTDGVWHYFVDAELGRATQQLEPRECCEYLIGKARERAGGHGDNLSLAVLRLQQGAA